MSSFVSLGDRHKVHGLGAVVLTLCVGLVTAGCHQQSAPAPSLATGSQELTLAGAIANGCANTAYFPFPCAPAVQEGFTITAEDPFDVPRNCASIDGTPQTMGAQIFMSPFTFNLQYIELGVVAPLCDNNAIDVTICTVANNGLPATDTEPLTTPLNAPNSNTPQLGDCYNPVGFSSSCQAGPTTNLNNLLDNVQITDVQFPAPGTPGAVTIQQGVQYALIVSDWTNTSNSNGCGQACAGCGGLLECGVVPGGYTLAATGANWPAPPGWSGLWDTSCSPDQNYSHTQWAAWQQMPFTLAFAAIPYIDDIC